MAPSTRSRGAPAPSRVYNSTPALQQVQFPPRKKTVRTYGRQNQRTKGLRQQTLTQIDFVSSFEEDAEDDLLSDATEEGEDGENAENKENDMAQKLPVPEEQETDDGDTETGKEEEEEEEEEEPVRSGRKRRGALKERKNDNQATKRRRTFGGNVGSKQSKNSRRKTVGDPPSSSYHTQTLTQYLAKDQLIKDSEDEDSEGDDGLGNGEDDGFDDWLRDHNSPSPQPRQAPAESLPALDDILERVSQHIASREGSIIPQTPAKRNRRAVIPSSSQLSTPLSSHLLSRYGPLTGIHESPSVRGTQADQRPQQLDELPGTVNSPTPTRRKLVIEDSYATGSWGSSHQTQSRRSPLKDVTADTGGAASLAPSRESSSALDEDLMETPTRARPRRDPVSGSGDRLRSSQARQRLNSPSPIKGKKLSPTKPGTGLHEIPDSDEESESWGEEEIDQENQAPTDEPERVLGSRKSQHGATSTETQRTGIRERGLSQASQQKKEATSYKDKEVVEDSTEGEDSDDDDDQFAAGPDTLFVMDNLGTSNNNSTTDENENVSQSQRQILGSTPRTTQPIPTPQEPVPSKPLRKPIQYPAPAHTQTQPLESQRVPLTVIQGLGEPAYATDILLPVSPTVVTRLASGHLVHIDLPFKIFPQVTRFWLYDGSLLQYLACPQTGVQQGPNSWRHEIDQVYELNNPRDEEDMREEEWYHDTIGRYKYLPPAIVSQLLSNLRHKLFNTGDDEQEAPREPIELPSDPPSDEQPIPLPNYTNQLAPSSSNPMGVSISQQVEAQLRSESDRFTENPGSEDTILVPSTPMSNKKTPTANHRQGAVHPSQATTASVASTPDKYHRHHHSQQSKYQQQQQHHTPSLRSMHPYSSSSHLTFQDYGSSSPPLVLPQSNNGTGTSQLLSKSQILPDSLLRDESQMPPEIWSSGEEDD